MGRLFSVVPPYDLAMLMPAHDLWTGAGSTRMQGLNSSDKAIFYFGVSFYLTFDLLAS